MTREEMKRRTKVYANRIVKLCSALPGNWVAQTPGKLLTPSLRLSGERAGVRGFEPDNLCLLTPALSSLGGGEGENGARAKCASKDFGDRCIIRKDRPHFARVNRIS